APRAHLGEPALLARRRRGRAALPALRSLRLLRAPAAAALPALPRRGPHRARRLRSRAPAHLHREPPALDPGLRPAVPGRDRRDRRAAVAPPHHEPGELRARVRPDRHAAARALRRARGRHLPALVRARGQLVEHGERRAAVTGIGQSRVGRRLNADPLALTVDACLAALEDAGLRREDIDGLSTYPRA